MKTFTIFIFGILLGMFICSNNNVTINDSSIDNVESILNLTGLPSWITSRVNENTTLKEISVLYSYNRQIGRMLIRKELMTICN